MASVISSISLSRKPLVSPGKVSTPITDTPIGDVEITDNFNTNYLLGKACRSIFQHSQMMSASLQSLPFSDEHATLLIDCSRLILQVPIQLPKYFFTSVQVTNVKLALSPPLPPPGQRVSLNINNHLTLKVEGIVEHSSCNKAKLFRSPTAVKIGVSPKLDKLFSNDSKVPELSALERTEAVEKDYFQAQFLLTLPAAGYYSVHIDARLLDNEGKKWHAGHKAKMAVVVDSEENFKQKQRDPPAHQSSGGKGSGTSHTHKNT